MKKALTGLGLICLTIGLIVILWSATFQRKMNVGSEVKVGESSESWEVSSNLRNFTSENRLILEIVAPNEWWLWFEPWQSTDFPLQIDFKPIDVSIIDPNGGKTNFTLYYAEVQTEGVYGMAQFFGATVNSNDGGLSMEREDMIAEKNEKIYYNYKNRASGIVKYDGSYKVVITNWYELGGKEPVRLRLYEQQVRVEKPYLFLTLIGGAVMILGIIFLLFGSTKPARRAKSIYVAEKQK